MAHVNGNAPKITLYTNHRCPYAHRAHIVVKELGLPYDEVIIDLDKPREQWYLDINPVSPLSDPSHRAIAKLVTARPCPYHKVQ